MPSAHIVSSKAIRRTPGLQFKRLEGEDNIYPVRIGLEYRAQGVMEYRIVWNWIGFSWTQCRYTQQSRRAEAALGQRLSAMRWTKRQIRRALRAQRRLEQRAGRPGRPPQDWSPAPPQQDECLTASGNRSLTVAAQ
jgi:hypothetical protein